MTAHRQTAPSPPAPVWTPPSALVERADMTALMREVGAADYNALWAWSVQDIERFWRTIWDRYDVLADGDPTNVLAREAMPGAQWFPDVALSFPEHVFRDRDPDGVAVQHASELCPLSQWTWSRLEDNVAKIRAGLVRLGVERGDRVVGYMPNIPEALAAFLAVASIGAIWSCCSPDFGSRTVTDRFAQIEPKVLLAVDGYRYGGRDFDRREVVADLELALPSLERTVRLPYVSTEGDWDETFRPTDELIAFTRVPFDHPLWIVYSSGTTGLPKAIVHGHGGPLLEHLKLWRLHHDVKPDDRILWFTTTGWIMWNYLACALLSPCSIVLFDGNPGHPDLGVLWDLADAAGVDLLGAGASFYHACMTAGIRPRSRRSLARLRALGSTGSRLMPEAYDWVATELGDEVWLASTSGGTDVASAFVGGAPVVPVHRGELPARMLGTAVEAWREDGQPVVDDVGELVVTRPMPSMPVRLWNDPGDQRYRDAYFSTFAGVWRQGDWIRITARGSAIVYGRSDATINRGGIRMGTAEIYAAVLGIDGVADALVVDVPRGGIGESRILLFVEVQSGACLSEELSAAIRRRVSSDCSPRHVPDEIIAVPEVPRTLTGKPLEMPVKRLLLGHAASTVANVDTLANPGAFDWFVRYAEKRESDRDPIARGPVDRA
jgi:acetoacetyl-CoA synthetase